MVERGVLSRTGDRGRTGGFGRGRVPSAGCAWSGLARAWHCGPYRHGAQREADPTLGLDAEPNPAESRPKSSFQFLGCRDPSDVLPGLGTGGSGPPHQRLDHLHRVSPRTRHPCQMQLLRAASPEHPVVLRPSPGRGESAKRTS